jgi:hypothetical protein
VKKTSRPTRASHARSKRPRPSADHEPHAALAAFARVAKRLGIRWYVFGAQAVSFHGFPRTTADLDLTIELGERSIQTVIAALVKAGFTPRFTDPGIITSTRVIPVVHATSKYPLDLVLAGQGLEEQFLDEVIIHKLGRTSIPVLSIENLIVTKLLAARPKDLEDIRELIAIREVDHAKVEALLATLEDALDQNDLRPLYRRLRG